MRPVLLCSLLITVAWGTPFKPREPQVPVPKDLQQPLVGDLLPAQGHVVLENPAPQPELGKEEQRSPSGPDNKALEASQVQEEFEEVPTEAREVPEELPLKQGLREDNTSPFVEVSLNSEEMSVLEPKVEVINNNIAIEGDFEQPIMDIEPLTDDEPKPGMIYYSFEEENNEQLNELGENNGLEAKYNFKQQIMNLEPPTDYEPKPDKVHYHFGEEENEPLHELREDNNLEARLNHEQQIMDIESMTDNEPKPDMIHYYFGEENEPLHELGENYNLEARHNFERPTMNLEPLTDEEMQREELLRVSDNHKLYEKPLMYMEPERSERKDILYAAMIPKHEQTMLDPVGQPLYIRPFEAMSPEEKGPMLDPQGQPLHTSNEYYSSNGGFRRLEPLVSGAQSQMLPSEEPLMHGGRSCSGVALEGKCFQFFTNAKKPSEAEYFCQQSFSGGHLASVTCPFLHEQLMKLMERSGGRRRTWVGGLRFLDTGRFVWLDGSRWIYADWLQGEPNNTADKEDCIEILPTGKFNDFTCWEPQAFICSYPYQ